MTATNPFASNTDYEVIDPLGIFTMTVDTTATKDFTQDDLDSGNQACVLSDDDEAGMGSSGGKLFGKVISVSDELDSNDIPVRCTVATKGRLKFKLGSGTNPTVGQMVEVDGTGLVNVAAADTDIAAGGHLAKGVVMRVNTTHCWVLL